jgi:MinD superfamily P-loop ATPase
VITADFIVSRALLRPGRLYADAVKAFSPYDRIRDPNPELRSDLVRLARTAERLRIPAWLIVNNRAEGSAPHTIAALAQVLAESPADTTTPRA